MKLQNKTKRTITLNLDHDVVCTEGEGGKCLCSSYLHQAREHDPRSGDVGIRESERRVCASVYILPDAVTEELPESVRNLPTVKKAMKLRTPALVEVVAE